jgi:hypothetical protein
MNNSIQTTDVRKKGTWFTLAALAASFLYTAICLVLLIKYRMPAVFTSDSTGETMIFSIRNTSITVLLIFALSFLFLMMSKALPKQIKNTFAGKENGYWTFGALTFMSLLLPLFIANVLSTLIHYEQCRQFFDFAQDAYFGKTSLYFYLRISVYLISAAVCLYLLILLAVFLLVWWIGVVKNTRNRSPWFRRLLTAIPTLVIAFALSAAMFLVAEEVTADASGAVLISFVYFIILSFVCCLITLPFVWLIRYCSRNVPKSTDTDGKSAALVLTEGAADTSKN